MTTFVSLDIASFEVGSVGASSTLFLGFSTIGIGVDSTTFSALIVTTTGLDTYLLGLVFSAFASTFLLIATLHLSSVSAFLFASYSN